MPRARGVSRRALKVSEGDIQAAILDYLLTQMHRNGRVVRIERRNSGTIRRHDGSWGAAAYQVYLPWEPHPLSSGVEDITGVLFDGRHFGIEVKSATGTLRPDQRKVKNSAVFHGLLHLVARSVDDVITWLDKVAPIGK